MVIIYNALSWCHLLFTIFMIVLLVPGKISFLAYLCQNLISLSDPNVLLLNCIEMQAESAQSSGWYITLPDWSSDDIIRSLDTYIHPGDLFILQIMLYTGYVIRTMTGLQEVMGDCEKQWKAARSNGIPQKQWFCIEDMWRRALGNTLTWYILLFNWRGLSLQG